MSVTHLINAPILKFIAVQLAAPATTADARRILHDVNAGT